MPITPPKVEPSDDEHRNATLLHFRVGTFHFQIDWAHWIVKALLFSLLIPHIFLAWWLLSPWSGAWSPGQKELPTVGHADLIDYFHSFSGNTECGISLPELYIPPRKDENGKFPRGSFCSKRETLLEGMTGGGRHGFDAPFFPKGCHYRWYTIPEICMILERFDSLIFLGDSTVQTIYSGLNILLRQDLYLGALNPSDLHAEEQSTCHCSNQFIKSTCSNHFLTSSDQLPATANNPTPYLCTRTPHAYLPTTGSPLSPSTLKSLQTLLPQAPPSNYHPIPLIVSLTPPGSPPSTPLATQTLMEVLSITQSIGRKTPILWLGPTASGHLQLNANNQLGSNHDLWTFATEMERVVRELDRDPDVNVGSGGVEALGLWNMTVQAGSWDGRKFETRVAVTQAMMVLNWLARLESS